MTVGRVLSLGLTDVQDKEFVSIDLPLAMDSHAAAARRDGRHVDPVPGRTTLLLGVSLGDRACGNRQDGPASLGVSIRIGQPSGWLLAEWLRCRAYPDRPVMHYEDPRHPNW